jgi:hypothetical protein
MQAASAHGNIFSVWISPEDELDREVVLQRDDLDKVKVLGIIATVKD